jgi:hypothetical protein
MTRRDIRAWLPSGFSALRGMALTAAASQEHTDADQDEANHARRDAMLHVNLRHAGLMAGQEAGQLIRRNQEIDGGYDEQDHAEHGQHRLHGFPQTGR